MLVVVANVVVVLLLLVAPGLLLGGAVGFMLIEILASIVTELLCPAPKVKREPAEEKKTALNGEQVRWKYEINTKIPALI